MNYYEHFLLIIQKAYDSNVNAVAESPQYASFPFKESWRGQQQAIQTILNSERSILSPPTGAGKSACFLTAATELATPTIVIEPMKFLQAQLSNYGVPLYILYGRKEYQCNYSQTAASAPCLTRYSKENEDTGKNQVVFDVFQYQLNGCNKSYFSVEEASEHIVNCNRCNAFTKILFEEEKQFPCGNCEYILALNRAKQVLLRNGILVVNSFNFYPYRDKAKFIIVDEVDKFFETVTSGVILNYVSSIGNVEEMLRLEYTAIELELKKLREQSEQNKIYTAERKLERLQFFISNSDLCFSYHKKVKRHSDRIYVEMLPQYEHILQRLFGDNNNRICLVSATPGSYDGVRINYEVPQRSLVLYTPIGKMTSTYVFQHHHEYLLENAYKFITYWFSMFSSLFGTKKVVVHCGNIGNFGASLKRSFDSGGKYEAILHERGNLKGTVETFLDDAQSQVLLVTSAEYGMDFKDIDLSFVLKVPYATHDERIRALEKTLGKEEFSEFYEWDAISRLIQASGRTARGAGNFSTVFLMDSKFFELYRRYNNLIPDWFKKRLIV